MKNTPKGYRVIEHIDQYREYFKNLPNTIPKNTRYLLQMRFVAITTANGNDAYLTIIQDETGTYTLLRPYNLLKSHLVSPHRRNRITSIGDILNNGIYSETGRRMEKREPLGAVIEVENSRARSGIPHKKHVYLITASKQKFLLGNKFEGKSGRPVWIHNSLLKDIFEEKIMVNGEKKTHPQIKAFRRFEDWLFLNKEEFEYC